MPLEAQYNAKILEELLIEALKTGTIPTLESLTDELETKKEEFPQLGEKPLFSLEDNSVEFYENASASKTNLSLLRYARDVSVMWETIHAMRTDIIKNARRWATAYETTRRFLDRLEDRIDNLLLLNSDTLGYFQYVSDDFLTTDYVDLENTTAEVNTGTGTVTIAEDTTATEGTEQTRIDLTHLTESNLSFSVTGASNYKSATLGVDSQLVYALSDEYSTWISYITCGTQASVTGSLTIDMLEAKAVNKIVFKVNGSTLTSAFSIAAMYSTDGVDYLPVPTDAYIQSTTDAATFVFTDVEARFWKFLITKTGADDKGDATYTYEMGAKNISFYQSGYEVNTGHTLLSTVRSVLDEGGEPTEFQKAILSVCEQVPDGTSIHYSIGIDSGSVFVPIDPVERTDPSRPQILDFSDLVALNNSSSSNVLETGLEADFLTFETLSDFTLVNEADALLNFYIPADDVSSFDETSVTIFRNVGDADDITSTVRGVARGWSFDADANTYSTVVRIDDPDGLDLDFGTTLITIDGSERTGVYNLSQGTHEVTTSADSWLDVAAGQTSLDGLKTLDTLYPYNHKLLIEGYEYGTDYSDEQVYVGASMWAELVVDYKTLHDFNTQVDTVDITAYTRDVDDAGKLVFIFKVDRSYSDQANERFLVEYKLTNKTFTDVVLKAIFTTTDGSLAPVLEGYVIKLG
jgi:hypothetical protein